jgi:hypothetical protein
MSTTIPHPDELRIEIRERAAELRALRKLLRLAEAAETVHQARQRSPGTDHRAAGAPQEGCRDR